jgi:hypothetical protein
MRTPNMQKTNNRAGRHPPGILAAADRGAFNRAAVASGLSTAASRSWGG